jgi:hypothetical protein
MTQGGIGATPGYDAIDLRRMIQAASSSQSGVFDATGWKVTEASAGANMTVLVDANAGIARVDGTSVTHQGPYIVAPHSADITLDVATAHATNPRIDMVVLQVRDHTHDASGSNDARVRILSGTATGGATLDNRTGAPALPANSIRLADVLVPAADTTISNSQIRDRRPWAYGARFSFTRTTTNYQTTEAATPIAIDSTNLSPRIECSGRPIVAEAYGIVTHSLSTGRILVGLAVDGTVVRSNSFPVADTGFGALALKFDYTPAAGSHVLEWRWRAATSAGTVQIVASATESAAFFLSETRASATNS